MKTLGFALGCFLLDVLWPSSIGAQTRLPLADPIPPAELEALLFRIGSITKTFTWIAVMKAVETGRLTLDDPVNRHLPEDLRIPGEGFGEPIRIRHLMTHSAGFEDRMFGHLFETNASELRPLRAYLREERPRRVREAGELHSYSNYGVALAGAALERINGRPWQDQIEAEILKRLGMTHTSVREPHPARDALPAPMPDALARQVATGYRWTGVEHQPQRFEYISHAAPAGVISSTAGDMARYMLMLLGGGILGDVRIIGPASSAAFRTPMTQWPSEVGSWNAGFLEVPLVDGFRSLGHDGGSLLVFSTMALVPELRLGVFVSTNTAGGDRLSGALPARIVKRFYGTPPGPPRAGSNELAASAPAYTGFYLQTRRAYSGIEGFIFRLLARQVHVTPDGYLIAPLIGQPRRFVPSGRDDVFEAVDADGAVSALLIRREENMAARIELAFMAFERVPFFLQPPTLLGAGAVTVLVSLGTLLGLRQRFRRALPQTPVQRNAARVQVAVALLWLVSGSGLALFAIAANRDESILFYGWPPLSLVVFSTAALLAAMLTVAMIVLLRPLARTRRGLGHGTKGPLWAQHRRLCSTQRIADVVGRAAAVDGVTLEACDA